MSKRERPPLLHDMDVMLRFSGRDPELERRLAERGFEVIIPIAKRDGAPGYEDDATVFNASLYRPDGEPWPNLTGAAERVLLELEPILAARPAELGGTVDFGVNGIAAGRAGIAMLNSICFNASLLSILGRLGLELDLSIFLPVLTDENYTDASEKDRRGHEATGSRGAAEE
jgi:hypothetical protein